MKFYITIFILLLTSYSIYSQTYIKVNAPTTVLGVPGIGVEVPVSKKMTFQLDVTTSFWNSVTSTKYDKRPYVFNQIFPEIRYHFSELNNGFYVGVHAGSGMFKLSKNSSYASSNKYQYGYIIFTGITGGFQKKIKERWLLDAFLGGGWSKATYEGFDRNTGVRYDILSLINYSAQWIPYRGGVMIGYKF